MPGWPVRVLTPLALISVLFAQPTNSDWRTKNDRGNRYEGYASFPIGNRFELVSFTALIDSYTGNTNLKVGFYLPDFAPATIIAREKQRNKYYWMESKPGTAGSKAPGWNEFAPWPTATVLRDTVPSSNLGVVVYLGRTDCSSCRVAPAWVLNSEAPAKSNRYTLYLRPNATMEQVEWHLYQLLAGKESEVAGDRLPPKQGGVSFPIDLDTARLPDGPLRLLVQGHISEDPKARPTLEVSFWHKRQGT